MTVSWHLIVSLRPHYLGFQMLAFKRFESNVRCFEWLCVYRLNASKSLLGNDFMCLFGAGSARKAFSKTEIQWLWKACHWNGRCLPRKREQYNYFFGCSFDSFRLYWILGRTFLTAFFGSSASFNEFKKLMRWFYFEVPNRVCVALSRARYGFYMIGNMDVLTHFSKLWRKICNSLIYEKCIEDAFPAYCAVHDRLQVIFVDLKLVIDFEFLKCFVTLQWIENSSDFLNKTLNGGCDIPCGFLRQCGHYCRRTCHK